MRCHSAIASRPAIDSSSVFGALEECVRLALAVGIRRQQQLLRLFRVVQRVEQPRRHARRVAERGMRRDVFDALAVDVDLAAVAQRLQVFRAVLRAIAAHCADVLALRGVALARRPCCHESLLLLLSYRS